MRYRPYVVFLSTVAVGGLGIALASSCTEPMLMACCTEYSNLFLCPGGAPCANIRTSGEEHTVTTLGDPVSPGGYKFDSVELKGICEYDRYACDGPNGCVYQGTMQVGCFSALGLSCPM